MGLRATGFGPLWRVRGARPGATSLALVDATMNARDITDRVAAMRRCEWAEGDKDKPEEAADKEKVETKEIETVDQI